MEDTFSDTSHEDDDASTANKLKGTAAYFSVGYILGIPANVTTPYRKDNSLGTNGASCFGTAYRTDKDIIGVSSARKNDNVYCNSVE